MSKDKLIQLARKIQFESVMFAEEFKHSKKEDLRYYLWQHELNLFIIKQTKIPFVLDTDVKSNERRLINAITFMIENGMLKTK